MSEFSNFVDEQLKDKDFKKEWDGLDLRYAVIEQLLKLRNSYNLSQSELAKKIGTTQSVISRIENGSVNIGIDMLERIASAFNKQIKINFS